MFEHRAIHLTFLALAGWGLARADAVSWDELKQRAEQLCVEANFAEAEIVLRRALKEVENFGRQDIRQAKTLHYLGTVYREMGRLSDAEHMYRRSLSAWEESVGKGHPALAEPLIRLAALYLENGMADRAERLVGRLHSAMNTRTPSDPDTPSLLHILAAVHHAQRRYAEAEPLYREALESTEKSFGPNDYRLLRLLDNLGLLLGQMGRPVEAVPYLERALLISEKALGPTHPNVARSLANLGSLYSAIGRYTNAEPLFLRAEAIAASNSGAESRLLGQVLAEYAVLLHKTGRRNESKALKSRAQAIRRSSAREDLGRHTVDFRDLIPSRNNG